MRISRLNWKAVVASFQKANSDFVEGCGEVRGSRAAGQVGCVEDMWEVMRGMGK